MRAKCSKIFTALTAVVLFAGVFAFASEMDSRIESSAQDSYVFKTYLKGDKIITESKDGVVTLKGTVKEESHKQLAQETVENLPGVTKVENQLVYKGKAPADKSDGWIAMKVKTALLFHRNVNAFKTNVKVKDGIVTLSGVASSKANMDLTGEYAGDVDGVKQVKNNMSIAKKSANAKQTLEEKVDDASITAQIKMALLTHRSTSMLKTEVKTINGVVTLGGEAKNEAEKTLVGKIIYDIKGVTSVVNNMTVAK